jgi:sortase A
MNYLGKRYVYKVSDRKIIKPTEWRVLQQAKDKPQVVLVTCTPVGTAQSRLLVYGEQISPDPGTAAAQPKNNENSNPNTIPGNSPTFFERLHDLLF